MNKSISALSVFFVLSIIVLSIRLSIPDAVKMGVIADSSFSVNRSFEHVKNIASAPHMVGSDNHSRVRDYIVESCRKFGLQVQVQQAVPVIINWGNVQAAHIQNIIAFKKGRSNGKSIVLMAHYDSEPNTPGAGDDGASVAAMLETARALQHCPTMENDLILLFTDGEEIGLMGANAFLKESPLAKNIGLVLNFEVRGTGGPSNMFEVNEQNGWVMQHYASAVEHPFANSLGYEVYKKLPNSTDFTVFKDSGLTGLNSALIYVYVHYQSPNDVPANLDLRSLQQHGENMLSLVRHFGNTQITQTKAADLSYFNALGEWFVHFPSSWNIFLVIAVNILVVWFAYKLIQSKQMSMGQLFFSILGFIGVLAFNFFASKVLLDRIIAWYPRNLCIRIHIFSLSGPHFIWNAYSGAFIHARRAYGQVQYR